MDLRPPTVRSLLQHLERLPGVGPRTAQRLAEHLLTIDPNELDSFASILAGLRAAVGLCSECCLLTETDPCAVCEDPARDRETILVVEEPTTAWAVEATGEYRGLYHALLGHLSPLHGVGPDDLTIARLEERCREGRVAEVILATDPTVEGETTALFIARRLQPLGIGVSRPASGIPVGGEVAAVDRVTLTQALQLRRKI
ncbi:MAG: recombination protein RecR [Acidobacteria bacterium]|nr:recombination protein RecR [Candidatus Sulfomarinibacter sp. MAG AM2]MBD3873480.1 recombination protein RecR [Candidatus Sulfomarinibacter sp. MAG AM1]